VSSRKYGGVKKSISWRTIRVMKMLDEEFRRRVRGMEIAAGKTSRYRIPACPAFENRMASKDKPCRKHA
jgi:hypothetical protein